MPNNAVLTIVVECDEVSRKQRADEDIETLEFNHVEPPDTSRPSKRKREDDDEAQPYQCTLGIDLFDKALMGKFRAGDKYQVTFTKIP